jgi:hypothetical protein
MINTCLLGVYGSEEPGFRHFFAPAWGLRATPLTLRRIDLADEIWHSSGAFRPRAVTLTVHSANSAKIQQSLGLNSAALNVCIA